jgi:hypothetical protein
MNNNINDPQQSQDADPACVTKKDEKDQIHLKIPGISLVIKTNPSQIIILTVIICVFIIVMTLIAKSSFNILEHNTKKTPADKLSAGVFPPL